ncbi:MAG: histidinol-phosphatase [Lachnospiraceae bacterium]|nr:histidinol-phosphatase [Lachnospiraceae bacterium]
MQNDYGYIDIHSHIIPEVDDGSGSIEETKAMLQTAYEEGIRTIIATPHFDLETERETEFLIKQYHLAQEEAAKIDHNFQIYLGNEIYYEKGCQTFLKEGKAFAMAKSRYVLVEFSPSESYPTIYDGMKEFILDGFIPIIAHIERYMCLIKHVDRIEELIELGCYMQVNASSLTGGLFNKQSACLRGLVTAGLVHFIATDCHHQDFRKPLMKACVKKLSKCVEEEKIKELLYENPKKILENRYI